MTTEEEEPKDKCDACDAAGATDVKHGSRLCADRRACTRMRGGGTQAERAATVCRRLAFEALRMIDEDGVQPTDHEYWAQRTAARALHEAAREILAQEAREGTAG